MIKKQQQESNGQDKITNDIRLSFPPPNQKEQQKMNREKGEKIQNRFNLIQEKDSKLENDGNDQNQQSIYNWQLYEIINGTSLETELRQSQLKIIKQQEQSGLNSFNKIICQNSHSNIQSLMNRLEFYNQESLNLQSYLWNDTPRQNQIQKPQQKVLLIQNLTDNYFQNRNLKRCVNQEYIMNQAKEQEQESERIIGKNQQNSKEKVNLSQMEEKNLKQGYVRGRGGKKKQIKKINDKKKYKDQEVEAGRVRYNLVTKRQLWMKGKDLFQRYSDSSIGQQRNTISKFKKSKVLNQTLLKELGKIQEINEFLINQIYTKEKRQQIASNIINFSGKSRQLYQQQKVQSRLQKFDFIRSGLQKKIMG